MNKKSSLIIKFWGVRGSIPSPLTTGQIRAKQEALIKKIIQEGGTENLFHNNPEKIHQYLQNQPLSLSGTYGGDTTCIEIQARGSPLVMIDAGSGARLFGRALFKRLMHHQFLNPLSSNKRTQKEIHLFFTHYHWDHLQGFPFFAPGFLSGSQRINIHFYGKKDIQRRLSEVLSGQQQYPNFPISFQDMPCSKEYTELKRMDRASVKIGALSVSYQELTHPGSVFAYAFKIDGKKFVCATDTEHKSIIDSRLIKLAQNADVLYYDSQYTPEEYRGDNGENKLDWGHSTYRWAVKTALAANVSTVILAHHEPLRDDFKLKELKERALAFRDEQLKLPENQGKQLKIIMGYQGLVIKL